MELQPKKVNANFLDDLLAKRSSAPRCDDHPQYLSGKCAVCNPASPDDIDRDVPADQVWQGRVREEWESRVPVRHRASKADHSAVLQWSIKVRENHREAQSLFLLGETGVGKTYQAYGALKSALWKEEKVSWQAVSEADLLGSMRPRNGVDPETELAKYRTAGILLVDDFGSSKASEWVEEVTYRIVNWRYEHMKPTIFTSNLTPDAIKDSVGDRVASRLTGMCKRVVLEGSDRRRG